jgi:glyoxylase-like metal-dependent hydrolase (beta-lactamase superfamily II)
MEVIADRSDFKIEMQTLGPWETNAYVITCVETGDMALIDVPPGAGDLVRNLAASRIKYILLTHNHMDHTEGLRAIQDRVRAPLAVQAADNKKLPLPAEVLLKDGDTIALGKVKIKVIHTPGHTPGSVCFKLGEYLIAGDTLFPGGPGRTDSPADFQQILKSITEKIFSLPENTGIFPGHGTATTIKKAKEEFAVFSARQHGSGLCGDVEWATA